MSAASHRPLLATTAAVALLLLAGCTPTATPGTDSAPGAGGGSAASGEGCSVFDGQTDPELRLFTTSALTAGPAQGQVFGDGTEFSVTLSAEAVDAGYLPQFELIRITESGGPELVSSLAFDPTTGADGTYSTSTLEFGNDELVGEAIVAEVFAISDNPIGDTTAYGAKVLLGNYCVTYGNDES